MEVLRVNGQVPSATFFDLVPSSVYSLVYTDLSNNQLFDIVQESDPSGTVTFLLDEKYALYDSSLEASVFNYLEEVVIIDNIDVVRPYVSNLQALSTSLNKSISSVTEMERIARYIIDSEVSQGFGYVRKEKEIVGNGSDYLVVNEKINKLYKVYENGTLVFDSTLMSNETNFVISKDRTSVVPIYGEDNKTEYPQVWRDRYLSRAFADGYDYVIDADFGYKVVPQDIQEAAKLLCADISSDNMKYLNKYIESFDNQDFKIKFAKNFNASTGNLIVDRILQKYKNNIRVSVL
jgi:hypothetical protein